MRNAAVWVALLLVGSAPSSSAWAKPKGKTVAAVDCAHYSQRQALTQDGLVLTVQNRCAEPVRCTLHYETGCGKGALSPHDESFELAGGLSQEFDATVSCGGESWRVSQATWRCRTKTGEHETAAR